MKLILIAGTNENLNKIAAKLKTSCDEVLVLQDFLIGESEIASLIQRMQLSAEILIVSEQLFGVVNSSVVKLFEALNGQNLVLNLTVKLVLWSNEDYSLIEKYLRTACNENNLSYGGISAVKPSKIGQIEELDILSKFDKQNSCEALNVPKNQLLDNVVTIYTDGACSGNPGAGGWGAILIHGDKYKEISGYERETTNNKMELTAVIKAIKELKKPCKVELYSDSAYVVNAITQNWLNGWKSNGWLGSDKKPVKNQELWKELDRLLNIYDVNFNKVKGHSDNKLNNRCDELATGEIAMHQDA